MFCDHTSVCIILLLSSRDGNIASVDSSSRGGHVCIYRIIIVGYFGAATLRNDVRILRPIETTNGLHFTKL